jgi:hypothetical protein
LHINVVVEHLRLFRVVKKSLESFASQLVPDIKRKEMKRREEKRREEKRREEKRREEKKKY